MIGGNISLERLRGTPRWSGLIHGGTQPLHPLAVHHPQELPVYLPDDPRATVDQGRQDLHRRRTLFEGLPCVFAGEDASARVDSHTVADARPDLPDQSASSYDMSLASIAVVPRAEVPCRDPSPGRGDTRTSHWSFRPGSYGGTVAS